MNLTESSTFDAGVYQIETTDPVLGGAGGIANRQAQALANRTKYLADQLTSLSSGKQAADPTLTALAALTTLADRVIYCTGADAFALTAFTAFARSLLGAVDAATARGLLSAPSVTEMNAAIAALVNSSPATLDTLNELAAALGNDPNFATTIAASIAAKAALASPTFTGNPAAPTPAQFDNDTSLATTAFVQRALGNMQTTLYAGSTTLTSADAGKAVLLATVGTVMTLPLLSAVPLGTVFRFVNSTSNGAGSVARQGSDLIYFGSAAISSVAVNGGESLDVVAYSTGWVAIGGSVSLAYASSSFGSSLAINGYKVIPDATSPSGKWIEQWGTSGAISAGSQTTITLPMTMPNSLAKVFVTCETSSSDTTPISGGWSAVSSSQFVLRNKSTAAAIFSWHAIGW